MVKCADCGFLALRHLDTQELLEAPQRYREHGNVPHNPERRGYEIAERMPVCFVQKRDFVAALMEWGSYPSPNALSPDDVVRLISEPFECPVRRGGFGFIRWQQGSSPREHVAMVDRRMRLEHEQHVREAVWNREDARDKSMKEREDRRDARMLELQERLHARELWIIGGFVT